MPDFIIIAEKIHCSRSLPSAHPAIHGNALHFGTNGEKMPLPVAEGGALPPRIRPFAVAARHLLHGTGEEQRAAEAFIAHTAREQTAAHAAYLDINTDEYSTDLDECRAAMERFVHITQAASALPPSIDSSHADVLLAGLAACRPNTLPLMNSLALDRPGALDHAVRFNALLILLCTPADGTIPADAEGRLAIQRELMAHTADAGIAPSRLFLDPLVMPVATDPDAPGVTLQTIRLFRETFGPAIHITGGISNVSFGMPARAIITNAFAHLCFAAGADSGILDPLLITPGQIIAPDTTTADYRFASALLSGNDPFGMEFLEAFRAGELSLK